MAIRKVRKDDDDILRKKSKKVTKIDENTKLLLDDMLDTMREENGVGLSAVQVGILKRIFIVDVSEEQNNTIEFINPEIIKEDGEVVGAEGCLSIPGVLGEVKRAECVKVKALDREGNEFEIEAEGFLARAILHENDHLNGVLFTDKVIKYIDPEEQEHE